MHTVAGRVLASVSVEALADVANLRIETGAIAEAHKVNEPVAASVCLIRREGSATPAVVTACGVCQERLRFWGPEVEVAVPAPAAPGWQSQTLGSLQPFWWGTQFGGL